MCSILQWQTDVDNNEVPVKPPSHVSYISDTLFRTRAVATSWTTLWQDSIRCQTYHEVCMNVPCYCSISMYTCMPCDSSVTYMLVDSVSISYYVCRYWLQPCAFMIDSICGKVIGYIAHVYIQQWIKLSCNGHLQQLTVHVAWHDWQ